jgi:DNA-binding NarL/FixJ family response regulator
MQKVLVIEDEAITSIHIETKVGLWGYEVVGTASTGEDGLKICRKFKPDLILMDIRLKGSIDGIETAKMIKKEMNIPIIYITAHSEDITINRALKTNPNGYMVKPLDDSELRDAIKQALENKN